MSGRGAYYKALYGGRGQGRGVRRPSSARPHVMPFTGKNTFRSSGSGVSSTPASHDGVDVVECMQSSSTNRSRAETLTARTVGARGSFHSSNNKRVSALAVGRNSSLSSALRSIEGRPYPAYKDLIGCWAVEEFEIFLDKVQSDPFAPPSRLRARLSQAHADFPKQLYQAKIRNIALCDYLTRAICEALYNSPISQAADSGGRWAGEKGGNIGIEKPGQHVLQRTSVVVTEEYVEARLVVALPARGRSVSGHRAAFIICENMIGILRPSFYFNRLDTTALQRHILSVEDQHYLREHLSSLNLAAFVINGACLPRRSGVDDRPLTKSQEEHLVLFQSPPSLEVSLDLPNRGTVRGMGIPRGITLIVGGGFHGKSTLLEALQWGIYDKIPGDGREFVAIDSAAVKIRAEDGRPVTSVDISPFINNLPFGRDTTRFSTADASGSTSQAANIIEALELKATTLLLDEDTCATNFMIRDARMQALVAKAKEPITPFLQKVSPLWKQLKVSTIMVVGGCGDFFDVAHTVILMDTYQAQCVTPLAKEIASCCDIQRASNVNISADPVDTDSAERFGFLHNRVIIPGCLAPNGKVKVAVKRAISYGRVEIDLSCVEQIAETAQTRTIARCLQSLAESTEYSLGDGQKTLAEILHSIYTIIATDMRSGVGHNGLDNLTKVAQPTGEFSLPRTIEIGCAINRLRKLQINSIRSVDSKQTGK